MLAKTAFWVNVAYVQWSLWCFINRLNKALHLNQRDWMDIDFIATLPFCILCTKVHCLPIFETSWDLCLFLSNVYLLICKINGVKAWIEECFFHPIRFIFSVLNEYGCRPPKASFQCVQALSNKTAWFNWNHALSTCPVCSSHTFLFHVLVYIFLQNSCTVS